MNFTDAHLSKSKTGIFCARSTVFQFNHNEQTIPSVGPVRLQYETIYTLGMATTAMSPQVV